MSSRSPRSRGIRRCVVAAAAAVLAACGSVAADPADEGTTPDAPPVTKERDERAGAAAAAAAGRSDPNVLAWVNGEPVNTRDILLRVGPQLATVGTDAERAAEQDRAVIEVLRERIVDRAARTAGIEVTRDELDRDRARRIRELEKNGGRLESYLRERGMTVREFDDETARELRMARYMRAAVGLGGDGAVRVRPSTDPYVAPREIRAFYDRNPARFQEPETARVRVLVVRADVSAGNRDAAKAAARRTAEQALARLRAGEDFVPVYRDVNRAAAEPDPSDGLFEITKRGTYADWIEAFAYAQPRGTLSGVEERGNAFYVLRAEGYSPARTVPFEEAHARIQTLLGQLKRAVASYEVELSLLEEAAVSPRERFEALREHLANARKRLILEAGI